jgi:hypothetical protein
MQCTLEPTGAYNSAANGMAECGIGVVCPQAQICLYASGLDVEFWCFALSHAALLCKMRPRLETQISSHEAFLKKIPNYANLAIWGSPVYVVDWRLTRQRPESATITGRFLGYAESHQIIAYKDDVTGLIQYAHHTAINELDLKNLPGNQGPAAKFLTGIIPDVRHELELLQAIPDLTPMLQPWLSNKLVSYHVPYDVTCNVIGVVTDVDQQFDCLKLVLLLPGSPAKQHLATKNAIGYYIFSMNGVRIRSVSDIRLIVHGYHELEGSGRPAYLTGITILFGITSLNDPEPKQIEFSKNGHATAQAVWSIIASSTLDNHTATIGVVEASLIGSTMSPDISTTKIESSQEILQPINRDAPPLQRVQVMGSRNDPRLANVEMEQAFLQAPDNDIIEYVQLIITSSLHFNTDVLLDEIIAFVTSIMASDLHPTCLKFWHHAMQDPVHKGNWIEAMYKHCDSFYAVRTFRPPCIPPASVTVLPAVIVFKMIINAMKQINAHKVRICAHGGHQEQGQDFKESFAHTVLGRLIKIGVAVSAFLGWNIFHFDIHNAFQTCPDNVPEQDCTWLCINQTWLDYYPERHPLEWPRVQALLDKKHCPEQFAVEMFMFVKGQTDASHKWGELIGKFVFDNLGLIANCADPCTYSGIYKGQPVILC